MELKGECRYALIMSCYARSLWLFSVHSEIEGNATYAFLSWNTVIITIVDMLFVKIKAILRLSLSSVMGDNGIGISQIC